MSISLADATELKNLAFTAYKSALAGKQYSISTGGTSRSFSRQEIDKLRSDYLYWSDEVSRIESGTGIKVRYGVPLDARNRGGII